MNDPHVSKTHIVIDQKYALLNQIGEGGFGGIFLAKDNDSNLFAVKLNRMEKSDQIEREVQLMNYFDHPNVLGVEDHSCNKGLLKNESGETVWETLSYLIMPFASLGDLGGYLTGELYFEEDVAAYFFHQIHYGLSHIHDKGYVHLDMKPDNILVTDDWQLKIADFGLSQPIKGEDGQGNFTKNRCGTTSFWSPEISLGFEYNGEQADYYAFGIILFIMVFGCRPFHETKTSDPLFMVLLKNPLAFWMTHPVTKTRIKARTVSEEVVDLLTRMLVVNPEERLSKNGITKHQWVLKYNKDIYSENDYEEIEFWPEILNSDTDSDYVADKSFVSDTMSNELISEEDEVLTSNKSISDIDIASTYDEDKEQLEMLGKCVIPKPEFLEKVQAALKSMKTTK